MRSVAAACGIPGVQTQEWYVAGIGDFNGDGRSDLFWRRYDNGSNTIWLSADASTQLPVPSVTGWGPVQVGDFDGDGRSDILWRGETGANVVYRSGTLPVSIAAASHHWWVHPYEGQFAHCDC